MHAGNTWAHSIPFHMEVHHRTEDHQLANLGTKQSEYPHLFQTEHENTHDGLGIP